MEQKQTRPFLGLLITFDKFGIFWTACQALPTLTLSSHSPTTLPLLLCSKCACTACHSRTSLPTHFPVPQLHSPTLSYSHPITSVTDVDFSWLRCYFLRELSAVIRSTCLTFDAGQRQSWVKSQREYVNGARPRASCGFPSTSRCSSPPTFSHSSRQGQLSLQYAFIDLSLSLPYLTLIFVIILIIHH